MKETVSVIVFVIAKSFAFAFVFANTPCSTRSTIAVEVNGSVVTDWMFDAGRNAVVILSNPPQGGDSVVITYDGG